MQLAHMPIRLGDAPVPTLRAPAGIGPSLRMRGAHELGDECTPRPGRLGLSRGNSKPTPRVYTRGERTGTGCKSDIGRWTLDPGLSTPDLKTLDFGTAYSFFAARLNPTLRSRPAPVPSKDPRMSARRLASDKGNSAHCWSAALRWPVVRQILFGGSDASFEIFESRNPRGSDREFCGSLRARRKATGRTEAAG